MDICLSLFISTNAKNYLTKLFVRKILCKKLHLTIIWTHTFKPGLDYSTFIVKKNHCSFKLNILLGKWCRFIHCFVLGKYMHLFIVDQSKNILDFGWVVSTTALRTTCSLGIYQVVPKKINVFNILWFKFLLFFKNCKFLFNLTNIL